VDSSPARGSTAYNLFDALRVQYGVERTGPEAAISLRKEILPVVQLEYVAPLGQIDAAVLDIQAAAGTFVQAFIVPAGERWILKRFWKEGTTAATRVVLRNAAGTELRIATTSATVLAGSFDDIQLEAGDEIGLDTTGNAGDSARGLHIAWTRYLVA